MMIMMTRMMVSVMMMAMIINSWDSVLPSPHTHSNDDDIIDNDDNIDTNDCYGDNSDYDDEDDGVLKNDGNNDKLMGVYSIPYLLLIRTLSTMIVVRG